MEPIPLHWKHTVLAIGPPGKSPKREYFNSSKVYLFFLDLYKIIFIRPMVYRPGCVCVCVCVIYIQIYLNIQSIYLDKLVIDTHTNWVPNYNRTNIPNFKYYLIECWTNFLTWCKWENTKWKIRSVQSIKFAIILS